MSKSVEKTTSFVVIIFLSFLSCGHVISAGVKSTEHNKHLPFIRSEADRWSFEEQMKTVMNVYMKEVEHLAKELINGRNLSVARVPDYSLKFGSQNDTFKGEGRGNIKNGYCKHLSSLNLLGDSVLVYENTSLIYTSEVRLWEQLECTHEFDVLLGNKSYIGPISIQYNDMYYQLRSRLDFMTAEIVLEDLQPTCIGGTQIKIDGPKENYGLPWLESSIYLSVSEMYMEGRAFDGVATAVRTVLEESTKNTIIRGYLPKLDFEKKYDDILTSKNVRKCPSVDSTPVPFQVVSDARLPYLKTKIEMWTFQNQMVDRLDEFIRYLIDRTASNLAERELLRAKLPDTERLFRATDKTNTDRYLVLKLTNGWILNPYEFVSEGINRIHFSGKVVTFSARVRLSEPLMTSHDFKAQIMLQEHNGTIEGQIDSITYVLDFFADLENPILPMEPPTIDCIGKVSVKVFDHRGESRWMSEGIANSARKELKDRTLVEAHRIISQAIEYVVAETDFTEHLPKWNYARNDESDLDVRFELEDADTPVCGGNKVEEATKKHSEFMVLMDENGKYQGPDKHDKPFSHITRVRQQPVPFITNEAQSWYLEMEMRKKMNEYMYKLLNETRNILRIRELRKVKIPDYTQAFRDEGEGNVFFRNGWLEDLSSVDISGIDEIEYNKSTLSLRGTFQLYRHLKFKSDYTVQVRRTFESMGQIECDIPSLIFSYKINVDYLGSKEVSLTDFEFFCVGGIKVNFISDDNKEGIPTEDILEATDYVMKNKLLEDVESVLRGALEDTISSIEFHPFLPEFDYKRDFWAELASNEKQNRLTNDLNICVSMPSSHEIEALYQGENTVPYEKVLKNISTEALRWSFRNLIGELMLRKVNSMWEDVKNGSLQRYNPPKMNDQATAFDAKGPEGLSHRLSINFENSWNDGISLADNFRELKLEFGLNDTVQMLYIQPWKYFKVKYDFSVTDHTKNDVVNGTIEAKAENPFYVMKSSFDLHKKRLSVEEYYAYCSRDVEINMEGIDTKHSWMMPFVEKKMGELFESDMLPSVSDVLFILYGYAADELEVEPVLIPWIYYESLYKVAVQDWTEADVSEKSIRRCDTRTNDYKTSMIRGKVPYIGSETEWWSFSRQVKSEMDEYLLAVTKQAKMFLVENLLAHPKLPERKKRFTAKDPMEREWKSNITLTVVEAEDLSQLYHAEDYDIEFQGKELIVTSYVRFQENLKFSFNFEALIGDETCPGKILATGEKLVYEMETRFNLVNRSAEIARFDLFCIGALELVVTTKDKHMRWASERISEIGSDMLAGMLFDDIRKITRIAYGYGLLRVDFSEYLPNWNYKKDYDYSPREEAKKTGFDLCTVNSTSADLVDQDPIFQESEEAIYFPE